MKPVRLHFFCAFHNAPWLAATVAASFTHITSQGRKFALKGVSTQVLPRDQTLRTFLLHFLVCQNRRHTPHAAPNFHPQKSSNQAQFVKIAKEITKFCQKKIEKCRKIFAKRIIFNYNKKYSRCYYQFVHQNLIQSNIRERER